MYCGRWHHSSLSSVTSIPMVGMFDAALGAITASGDYDAARACAGQELEQIKSLPYEAVGGGLPGGACEPSGLSYEGDREFVDAELRRVEDDRGLAKGTVTVWWDEIG